MADRLRILLDVEHHQSHVAVTSLLQLLHSSLLLFCIRKGVVELQERLDNILQVVSSSQG